MTTNVAWRCPTHLTLSVLLVGEMKKFQRPNAVYPRVQVPVVVLGVQGLDSVTLMKESGAAGDY